MSSDNHHIDNMEQIAAQDAMMRQIREAARVPGMGAGRQAASHGALQLGQATASSVQVLPNPDGSGRLLWIPGHDPFAKPGYFFGRKPLTSTLEENDF